MRAISAFSFDSGTSTFGWSATMALRTRVSISAIGSLGIIARTSSAQPAMPAVHLPARLHHARNLAAQRQLPEAQPADPVLAEKRPRTPAAPAAVAVAALQLRRFCLLRL